MTFPQQLDQLVSVEMRQAKSDERNIRAQLGDHCERRRAVERDGDVMSTRRKQARRELTHVDVVIDHDRAKRARFHEVNTCSRMRASASVDVITGVRVSMRAGNKERNR